MLASTASAATISPPTERIVGVSDALFAIAMTFLALDLSNLPEDYGHAGGPTSTEFLHEHLANYVVYFGVFLIVGLLWLRHHQLFRFIKQRSVLLMWTNWVLLAFVALLPYPAALVAGSLGLGSSMAFLLGVLTIISLLLSIEWTVSRQQGLVLADLPPPVIRNVTATMATSFVILLAATGIALLAWSRESDTLTYVAAASTLLLGVAPFIVRSRWPPPVGIVASEPPPANRKHPPPPAEGPGSGEARLRVLARLKNGSDTERLKLLTDGIIAIAVTILALRLQPPEVETEPLTNVDIVHNVTSVPWLPYLIAFLLIGLFWSGHVRITDRLLAVDPLALQLNLVLLMFIAFVPFTDLLVSTATPGDAVPTVLYLATMAAAALALTAFGFYVRVFRRMVVPAPPQIERFNTIQAIALCASFLVSLPAVVITGNPLWAYLVLMLLLVRDLVIRRLLGADRLALD